MMTGVYRPAIKYRIAASIKKGEITGYHLKEAAVDSNMYGLIPNFFPAGAIENYQIDVAKYDSNITTGAWRAPYTNFLSYAEHGYRTPKDGVYQGVCAYYCHNTHVAEVADVVMEGDQPVVKKITVAVDCGIVVNPSGAKNQIEGGAIDGVGHSMYADFTFENGMGTSNNYDKYRLIRMNETPIVETHFVKQPFVSNMNSKPILG